jgi:hypothetical protein
MDYLRAEEISEAIVGQLKKSDAIVTPFKSPSKLCPIPPQFWAAGLTAIIAGSIGLGFGLALRLNRPQQAGSSLWHSDQSFPPKPDSIPASASESAEP